jgi:hypothetical protein
MAHLQPPKDTTAMPATATTRSPDFGASRALASPRLAGLPKEARDRFQHLRALESRAAALRDGLLDQRRHVRTELEDAQRELGRFDREHQPDTAFAYEEDAKTGKRKRVPAVFPERVKLVEQINTLKAEMARLDTEAAETARGYTTDNILSWLNGVPATARFAVVAPRFVVPHGKTLDDVLDANRQEQAVISERIAELENAQNTVAEAMERIRADVNALAERGRPDISEALFGGSVRWPMAQLVTEVHGEHSHVGTATVKDTLGLFVWLNREAVLKRLEAEVEANGDDQTAVPATDRVRLIAEAKAKLRHLQHVAEAVILRLEASGTLVKRTCVDPLVLLGLDDGALSARSH